MQELQYGDMVCTMQAKLMVTLLVSVLVLFLVAGLLLSRADAPDGVSAKMKGLGNIIRVKATFAEDILSVDDNFLEVIEIDGKVVDKDKYIAISVDVYNQWAVEKFDLANLDRQKTYLFEGYMNGGYSGIPDGMREVVNVPEFIHFEYGFTTWFEFLRIVESMDKEGKSPIKIASPDSTYTPDGKSEERSMHGAVSQ